MKRLHIRIAVQVLGLTLEVAAGNEITAYLYTPKVDE